MLGCLSRYCRSKLIDSYIFNFIKVNTSGEENKNGIEPTNVTETVKHILDNCKKLKFSGLMTIGDLGNSAAASAQVRS